MSEENVGLVRAIYEPLNRGDWPGVFRDAHPDFEITITTQAGATAGTYRGQEAVRKQIEDLVSPFEAWTVEPEEFFEGGDQVVAYVKVCARPKGGSIDIEVRNGHLWTIRNGTVRSMKTFAVGEEALEAAGLRE
jgi:ketosteroid isomerase-like protein